MDDAKRWRAIAGSLADALDSGDEAAKARALAIYRQAAWREDIDDAHNRTGG